MWCVLRQKKEIKNKNEVRFDGRVEREKADDKEEVIQVVRLKRERRSRQETLGVKEIDRDGGRETEKDGKEMQSFLAREIERGT